MNRLNNKKSYNVVGLMSGSSLDGLDIAYCRFDIQENNFDFEIVQSITIPFPKNIMQALQQAVIDNNKVQEADLLFGDFCGAEIFKFLQNNNLILPDFIASHGHTIAHHPEKGFSLQIGNAINIRKHVSVPIINDFRNADIRAGGQGAPLVPMCDAKLFSDFEVCLNIGGIANISLDSNGKRFGFDICGANQILNSIAGKLNMPFDDGGKIAATGKLNQALLQALNADKFLHAPFPKSLDNAYVQKHFISILDNFNVSLQDQMATATEHIAQQISSAIQSAFSDCKQLKILVTGGGAYNTTLVNRIAILCNTRIQLPTDSIIQFKEALAIALMGVLRWKQLPNFFPSVTGARIAVCGGEIIQ